MRFVGGGLAAILAMGVCVTAAAAAAGRPPSRAARDRPAPHRLARRATGYRLAAGRPAPPPTLAPLVPFRVDVSRSPQIGAVVMVAGASTTLSSGDFTVQVGTRSEHPNVRQLSPDDLELVLSPDVHVPMWELEVERAAGAGFIVGLPAGAQIAVGDAGRLTDDPTAAMSADQALARGPAQSPAARLTAALSAFSPGASVRRTVVLVVTAGQALSPAAASRFWKQLAASGTELYVLDAAAAGAPAYDALAASSGGFAVRIRTPADWPSALRRVTADLNQQYYVRFTDPLPLPGDARISVDTPQGLAQGVVGLPAANPTAPPVPAPPAPVPSSPPRPVDTAPLALAALAAVALVISYGLAMFAASRREPRTRRSARRARPPTASAGSADPEDLFFVFLLPCLNEEKVILNSLQRLLSLPGDNFAVMVIDDGSDDGTSEVVSRVAGDRVWLLRRTAPNARQGKGEALNAAIARLCASPWLEGRDLEKVIVVVLDADGRLDPHGPAAVTPYFADPVVGAVQIGVRINNRRMSRLARMQDMEFVIYTEVFQRGRRHLGSVGLGGNGQFMRLSALRSLGEAPWSRSLTEDLDLGIRLLTAGWRNEYCHTAAVHQQGVIELRRLIRQRSRWFQGHLQSWKLIPTILRGAPKSARADLLYHLSSPAILLIASLLTGSFVCSLLGTGMIAARGGDPLGWWVLSTYVLAFGPALLYSYTYWLHERHHGVSLRRTAGLAHLYVGYCLMWYAAGWWAVGRTLRRRTNWSKTDRVAEAPLAISGALAVASSLSPTPAAPASAAAGSVQALPGTRGPAPLRHLEPAGLYRVPATAPTLENGSAASAPGEPPPGPGRPRPVVPARARGRVRARKWVPRLAVAAAIFVALGGSVVALHRGGGLQRSQWYQVFNGYGHTTLTGSGTSQAITLSVATTRSKQVTHAALVLSRAWYQNFLATAQVRTIRQLRGGSAGTPNPWEVGWVVWHYSSPKHFYALTLEANGWLLSKQDPTYPGGERFLASGKLPRFSIGVTHRVGVVQLGNQITVSADGHLLAKFVDAQRPYLTGGFGMYAEDSVAKFSDIHLQSLPGAPAYMAKTQPSGVTS